MIAVGQRWRDRDKRSMSGHRVVVVLNVTDTAVYYDHPDVILRRGAPYRSTLTGFRRRFKQEPSNH
jgi:hypothetical protein